MSFERRQLGRGGSALVPTTLERAGFLVAFTERTGGASSGPFDSLNLSQVMGDHPDSVRRNRRAVVEGLGLGGAFALPEQVHGPRVARVDASMGGAGFDDPTARVPAADGLVTVGPGIPLAVLTADCMAVAMAHPATETFAVVHAGWRGLAAGILAVAAAEFEEPSGVLVAIGPAIGPDHYEVGDEVIVQLRAASGAAVVAVRTNGRFLLDLPSTAVAILRSLGIDQVEVAGACTACHPERFYSHRRDGVRTGRQALVAVRR